VPAIAATAATLAVTAAGPAAADPTSRGETIMLTCDGSARSRSCRRPETGVDPGIVSLGTRVPVPYSFDIVGAFTPSDGSDAQTFEEHTARNAPRNGRLDTCTFSESDSDENGSFTFAGTVGLSYTH
jgi:hypothetical protein